MTWPVSSRSGTAGSPARWRRQIPKRRFLIAATANGMTDDIGGSIGNLVPDASLGAPANGTIFKRLTAAGISWIDYAYSFPTEATMELYPTNDGVFSTINVKSFDQFCADARAGTLPSFSLLDPNHETQAQENPQNIVLGSHCSPASSLPSAPRPPSAGRC